MKPPIFSTSMSFHRMFSPHYDVLRVWRQQLPLIRPCYAMSNTSTHQTIAFMREHRIPMLCETHGQASAVNDFMLTIENKRFGRNEYIARNIHDTHISGRGRHSLSSSSSYWVYTKISHDGIEDTRKMFEHIWSNKHILKGVVFDIRNFSDSSRGSLPSSIYSYKIALDYLVRNIVRPFECEYGISTPCIMMDGRGHITRIEHLEELRSCIEPVISVSTGTGTGSGTGSGTEFQLIVDDVFDR
jgi:hypothetical protein